MTRSSLMNTLLVILALITVAAAFQLPTPASNMSTMFKGLGLNSSSSDNIVSTIVAIILSIPLLICVTICLPCFGITYVICCPCCTVLCFCYANCVKAIITSINAAHHLL